MLLIIAAVAVGYIIENDWTGFRDYQPEKGPAERGKTLWDWLDLLIIPAVLAFFALWFNTQNQQTEREIASERNQEAALQAYLDKMTELLLREKKALRTSELGDEVRTVARTRTLTVLRGLEPERKSAVMWFLIEAGLVSVAEPRDGNAVQTESIVSLEGANLKGANLEGANLRRADLSNANLEGVVLGLLASLEGANLSNANLRGADLWSTNLNGAFLGGADLEGAELLGAKLEGANLLWANLTGANLRQAKLKGADLSGAKLGGADLTGGILPDGSEWTAGTDMSRFTNPQNTTEK